MKGEFVRSERMDWNDLNMLERMDYFIKNGKITVYRCYGEGTFLELPERIGGLPVAELADHCFAPEPSARYKAQGLFSAWVETTDPLRVQRAAGQEAGETASGETTDPLRVQKAAGQEAGKTAWVETTDPLRVQRAAGQEAGETASGETIPPLCGETLREIRLPDTLEGIGDYAFYGCLNLETLHLPYGLKRLGGGAFVACNHIRKLYFSGEEAGTPYCLKDVAAELNYEIEVILETAGGIPRVRLVYPEYYEESIENTPARIIEIVYHGTGYKYRQCFQSRQIDFNQYDSVFPLAVAQEFLPTLLQLTLDRLATPVGLADGHRDAYLSWLREEYRALADRLFREDEMELLRMLGQYEYYTREILEEFIKTASAHERAEAVSYLMEYRRRKFPAGKKKYVL